MSKLAEHDKTLLNELSSYPSMQSFAAHNESLPKPPRCIVTRPQVSPREVPSSQELDRSELIDNQLSPNKGALLLLSGVTVEEGTNGHDSIDGNNDTTQESPQTQIGVPEALQGINLALIESRADLIKALTQRLPLNEYNLPRFIYRSDLLDWRLFYNDPTVSNNSAESTASRLHDMEEALQAATIRLSYDQGFPALPNGVALWARLSYEPEEHYAAFTEYCTMAGARNLAKLLQAPLDTILHWYNEDYWAIRVKCYDMMSVIHAAKVREQRILACVDNHYLRAERVLKKLDDISSEVAWESLANDPEKFVNVMDKVIKLQRQVLGIMANNGSGSSQQAQLSSQTHTESVEFAMKKLVNPSELKLRKDNEGFDIRKLLQDPDSLASAQDLVIRMTRTLETTQNEFSSVDMD